MRLEDALQMSVCGYLASALPSTAWYCSIPNGAVLAGNEQQRKRQMTKLKATGLKVGAPDLFVIHDGRFFAIELKAGKGRATEAQLSACDDIVRAGGGYTIARSIEDVESYLRAHGVPLKASCGEARPIGQIIAPTVTRINSQHREDAA